MFLARYSHGARHVFGRGRRARKAQQKRARHGGYRWQWPVFTPRASANHAWRCAARATSAARARGSAPAAASNFTRRAAAAQFSCTVISWSAMLLPRQFVSALAASFLCARAAVFAAARYHNTQAMLLLLLFLCYKQHACASDAQSVSLPTRGD